MIHGSNTSIQSRYTLLDGYLTKDNRLSFPRTSLRFLVWETHPGGLAGHFGRNKTILAVEDQFFWPNSKRDVTYIVSRCHTCAIIQNPGFHTPVPAPNPLWQDLGMDFVSGTQMRHDFPKTVILDRGVRFATYFRKTLWHMLGTKQTFSISYHP